MKKHDIDPLSVWFWSVVALVAVLAIGVVAYIRSLPDEHAQWRTLDTIPGPPTPDPGTYPSFEVLGGSEADNARHIQQQEGGELEVVTPDGSRIDLLTDEYATEIDWSHKWAEAVGQALFYAAVTDRRPRVILLVRDREQERRYYLRALVVCGKVGVRLETREALP